MSSSKLLDQLNTLGIPLREYINYRLYRGMTIDFNRAFIIDTTTYQTLIAREPNSAELLKPWLRDKDIKKWQVEWTGLYLLFIPWHCPVTNYPAIYEHLSPFRQALEKRPEVQEGRYPWYALSRWAAEYHAEFAQPKIIWGNLATQAKFAYDTTGSYISAPANLIPTEDLYLLALLNSPLCEWFISLKAATRAGGFFEFKPMYVAELPIFPATEQQKAPIVKTIQKILTDSTGRRYEWMEEVNERLFDYYQLTTAERNLLKEVEKTYSYAAKTYGIWKDIPEFCNEGE